jgi:hypothetical protein
MFRGCSLSVFIIVSLSFYTSLAVNSAEASPGMVDVTFGRALPSFNGSYPEI